MITHTSHKDSNKSLTQTTNILTCNTPKHHYEIFPVMFYATPFLLITEITSSVYPPLILSRV